MVTDNTADTEVTMEPRPHICPHCNEEYYDTTVAISGPRGTQQVVYPPNCYGCGGKNVFVLDKSDYSLYLVCKKCGQRGKWVNVRGLFE